MLGQTISHYRILSKLGEGGMGVVYKAEDLKLRRTVALKFLPQHLAENRERFLREAQAAAALNHPNICTVFEIDEEHWLLAMEFIDGESVKDKIARRPLPLDEALDIAIQAAQGLEAAHQKSVVHRDIKPANLMLTAHGQVKVMDFGLAQMIHRTRLTKTGLSLGTPAYMSPEQAEGKPTDRRTDLWSLGVVLYEMVTGRLPFAGETDAAVSYAIVHTEPEPPSALRTGVPIELDRIVAKLLAKDPAERYQHVEDLATDLRQLRKGLVATTLRGPAATPRTWLQRERIAWALVAVLVIVCVWLAAAALRKPLQHLNRVMAFSVVPSALDLSAVGGLALSPDGSTLVFSALEDSGTRKLWSRRLDSPEVHPLEGTEEARQPFWSPNGRFVGFFASQKLKKMEMPGGPAIDICHALSGRGASWSSTGVIVFQPSSREPLHVVSSSGGEPIPITELSAERLENSHRWPHFLPDGRHFLYTARATPEDTAVYVGSLDSKQGHRILPAQSNAIYAPPHDGIAGQLLFVRDDVLFAQPFDPEALELHGEATVVARGLPHSTTGAFASFAVSGDGQVLAYTSGGTQVRQLSWFDRRGGLIRKYEAIGPIDGLRLSPDGAKAVLSMPDPYGGNRDVWAVDLSTGSPERLTTDPANDWIPVWSPTGDRILFASDREGGKNSLYTQPSSGAAQAERLLAGRALPGAPDDWSADGKYVTYHDESRNLNLWILPLQRGHKPIPFAQNQSLGRDVKFSPDGRWIAFASSVSGQFEVYVHSLEDALSGRAAKSPGKKVSVGGGAAPRWRRDGKELFYLRPDETLMSLEFTSRDASSPKPLFKTCPGSYAVSYYEATYDAAPDGRQFLFACRAETSAKPEIRVIVNWAAALQ